MEKYSLSKTYITYKIFQELDLLLSSDQLSSNWYTLIFIWQQSGQNMETFE